MMVDASCKIFDTKKDVICQVIGATGFLYEKGNLKREVKDA